MMVYQLSSLVQAVVQVTDKAVPVEVKLGTTEALVEMEAPNLQEDQEHKVLTEVT